MCVTPGLGHPKRRAKFRRAAWQRNTFLVFDLSENHIQSLSQNYHSQPFTIIDTNQGYPGYYIWCIIPYHSHIWHLGSPWGVCNCKTSSSKLVMVNELIFWFVVGSQLRTQICFKMPQVQNPETADESCSTFPEKMGVPVWGFAEECGGNADKIGSDVGFWQVDLSAFQPSSGYPKERKGPINALWAWTKKWRALWQRFAKTELSAGSQLFAVGLVAFPSEQCETPFDWQS